MCTFICPHRSKLNSAFQHWLQHCLVRKNHLPFPQSWGAASYFHRAWPEYSLALTLLLAHFGDHDIFQVPIQHSSPSDTALCSSPWEALCLHIQFMDGPNSLSEISPMNLSLKQLELYSCMKKQCESLAILFRLCCRLCPSLTGLPTAPTGWQELPKARGQVLGCTASQEEFQHLQPPLDSIAELNWWFLHNCAVIAIMVGG